MTYNVFGGTLNPAQSAQCAVMFAVNGLVIILKVFNFTIHQILLVILALWCR